MYYQNKNNENIYKLVQSTNDKVLLSDINSKETKIVTQSTLKRHYQQVEYEQLPSTQQRQYPYYKQYKRNAQPLWNVQIDGNALYINNSSGAKVIKCTMSKSKICIRIEQVALRAKRYFSNFDRAKRHILYDQDINTTKYIGEKFDKWLKQQMK